MAVKSEILVRNFCWRLCAVKYDLCMMKLEQDDRSSGTWTGKLGGRRFSSACLHGKQGEMLLTFPFTLGELHCFLLTTTLACSSFW